MEPDKLVTRDTSVPHQVRWALDYIMTQYDEGEIKHHRSGLRDSLLPWIKENGEEDENGNFIWLFDEPINGPDGVTTGLIAQRRVSEFINEDTAWALVEKYGVREKCVALVEELDLDAMYALNQEGVISDEDIDSILELNETFALTRIKE